MSWRDEMIMAKAPASALCEEEKDFLKMVKKIRDIVKLQEKIDKGEKLQEAQMAKVREKDGLLKDIEAIAGRLPATTEVMDKNQDVTSMLSGKAVEGIKRKQRQAQEKAEDESRRRAARDERQREERNRPEFMTRHDRPILGIAVSKDGFIYTCSKDKFVLCWSMESQLLKCVCTYAGHRGAVRAVDTGPSGLISGDSDGKILLWDKDHGKKRPCSIAAPLASFNDGGNVRVLRWCPFDNPAGYSDSSGGLCRFASACEKLAAKPAAIAVWNLKGKTAELMLRLEDLPGKANDLRWAGGAKTKLLSCHDNGYIGVWLAEGSGSLLKTLKLHEKPIAMLCITGDGKACVTASHDSSVKVVDISTPATETIASYKADRPLNAVAISADYVPGTSGHLVVAGGRDPMVVTTSCLMEDEFEAKILHSESGVPVAAAKGHFGPVHDVVFMPWLGEEGGFATCSEDGCLRVHALDGSTLHSDRIE